MMLVTFPASVKTTIFPLVFLMIHRDIVLKAEHMTKLSCLHDFAFLNCHVIESFACTDSIMNQWFAFITAGQIGGSPRTVVQPGVQTMSHKYLVTDRLINTGYELTYRFT